MRILLIVLALCSLVHAEGKRYAVLVGIDRYERPDITPLRCAVADAHALAGAFRELHYDRVFEMTANDAASDDYPNRVNVLFRLDWLRERVKPEDTVVFFFSGHGVQQEDKTLKEPPVFLLTKESDARSLVTLTNSACPASEITRVLNQMQARRILVVYDACRSNVRADRGADDNRLSQQVAQKLTPVRNDSRSCLVTLFSCSPGQRAYEGGSHGYFTACLLKGMSGQPPVTLQALLDYLPKAVSTAADENNHEQTPYWSVSGSLPPAQWALTDRAITLQDAHSEATTAARSHQAPGTTTDSSFADGVGTWAGVWSGFRFEKVIDPGGAFVDYSVELPGMPGKHLVRTGHLTLFSGGRFSWLIDAGLNQGQTEFGTYRIEGNQAFLHYETGGGFDIVWTRK